MRFDGDAGRNCESNAALVLRQVLPLVRCNCQDQVFPPIACDQKVLLSDRTQTYECEFAGDRGLPQPVEWNIGKPISF